MMKKDLQQILGKSGQPRCWCCGIYAHQLPESTILQACAKCKKINRSVLYCSRYVPVIVLFSSCIKLGYITSRECQKDDWKNGTDGFAPQKETCGNPKLPANLRQSTSNGREKKKVLHATPVEEVIKGMSISADPQTSSAAEQNLAVVPRSNEPYQKSAALLYQQALLAKSNGADYVVRSIPQQSHRWRTDRLAQVVSRSHRNALTPARFVNWFASRCFLKTETKTKWKPHSKSTL